MKIMIRSLAVTMTHWPSDGEEHQRVILAGLGILALEIPVRRKHGQDADADDQNAEEGGEAVDDQQVRERRARDGIGGDRGDDGGDERRRW